MTKTKWILDSTHSELGFKIKHLMITNVSGTFKAFTGQAETAGEDFSTAAIALSADISSISTNNEQRDAHLLASDFFEADLYPTLAFHSTKIEQKDSEHFIVTGDLTLKGITKAVRLNAEMSGVTKDPWGGERAGFVVSGKINRSEWGLNFNAVLETGGMVLSEEVKIFSEVQLVKQVVPADAMLETVEQ